MIHDKTFHFCSPVKAHFGVGSRYQLLNLLSKEERIAVISGKSTLGRTGLDTALPEILAGKTIHFFQDVEQNPSIETITTGAQFIQQTKSQAIVAIGGGSAMDAAKAMAILATNEGTFYELQKLKRYKTPPTPLIALPTTCGTGSEMNQYAIITDTAKKDKINLSAENSFPHYAILDPELLQSLPKHLVLATAFDALTHALEGYLSKKANPFSDQLALEAIKITSNALAPNTTLSDTEKLSHFLYASALAGVVISHTGTTLLHAMGYYLTNHKNIHHGTANTLLLPYFIKLLKNNDIERYNIVADIFDQYHITPETLYKELTPSFKLTNDLTHKEITQLVTYALKKPNAANSLFSLNKDEIMKILTGGSNTANNTCAAQEAAGDKEP